MEFEANVLLNPLNERMNELYYMLEGKSELGMLNEKGDEKIIWFLGEGCLFPLYSPMHWEYIIETDTLFLRSITRIKAIKITQKQFKDLVRENVEMSFSMLDQYADLCDLLLYEVMNHSYENAFTKVCSFLWIYNQRLQTKGIEMTQEKIALTIGTTRLNVSRALKNLREQNIIETNHKQILIHNEQALKKLCKREILEDFDSKKSTSDRIIPK
ncbi:Crp/Fnr family transcriptional regulator [Eubacterium barkeri]|uniref:Crp/Fnr family transcriptional regulator n=1 Tax=Eubacterium barkeri TaxID=1528 RepID=UPI0015A38B3C|nr:Crp/Fnr family transcriptional regulator [Eubacterium barkeri]